MRRAARAAEWRGAAACVRGQWPRRGAAQRGERVRVVARLGVAWHGASVGQGGCGVSGRRGRPGAGCGPGREQGRGGVVARPSRAEQGKGAGPVLCRVREGGRRREEGEGRRKERKEEKKRKEKENGKKKRKRKRRGEKREKGERERFAVIPPVATATPVGHAWLSRPRAAARRDARVEGKTGFWIQVSGLWENRKIWRNREDSGRLGLGFQGGISSSTTKQNFSARFILGNFRDVTNLPHLK